MPMWCHCDVDGRLIATWLQRKPLVSNPGKHHGTCVTHVPWCMSGSLTRGGGKRSRHSRSMRNPQFCVSGKRSMGAWHCIADKSIYRIWSNHYSDVIITATASQIHQMNNLFSVWWCAIWVTDPLKCRVCLLLFMSLHACEDNNDGDRLFIQCLGALGLQL